MKAIRSIAVTEVTFYRWRTEYGGLKGDQSLPQTRSGVKRVKELETDNARLRRADMTLDKMILAEAGLEKLISPRRRDCVDRAVSGLGVTERRAGLVQGQHHST